jgi:hypothetical protein
MTTRSLVAALAAVVSLSLLSGCAENATEADDGALGTNAAELSTTGKTYAMGTQLETTANLNLRRAGSRDSAILRVIPKGTLVSVWKASGGNAWVAIEMDGFQGYGHGDYLDAVGSSDNSDDGPATSSQAGYSASRANRLASRALSSDGRRSSGDCALYVSNHVVNSGILPSGVSWQRNHADPLHTNMANNPAYTARVGFKQLSDRTSDIPKGSIIGWRRGQCGYSSSYGHIEISVDNSSSRACSDFCSTIKKSCGAPRVFMPIEL